MAASTRGSVSAAAYPLRCRSNSASSMLRETSAARITSRSTSALRASPPRQKSATNAIAAMAGLIALPPIRCFLGYDQISFWGKGFAGPVLEGAGYIISIRRRTRRTVRESNIECGVPLDDGLDRSRSRDRAPGCCADGGVRDPAPGYSVRLASSRSFLSCTVCWRRHDPTGATDLPGCPGFGRSRLRDLLRTQPPRRRTYRPIRGKPAGTRAAPSEPVGTGPRLSRPLYPIPVPRPATGLRFPRPTDRRSSLAAHSKYEEELDGHSGSRGGSARAPRPFRYLRYRVRRGTGDGATGAAASRRRPVAGCRGDCQAARHRTPADRAPSWRHRLRFHPPRDRDP